jgi:hypothetical protein
VSGGGPVWGKAGRGVLMRRFQKKVARGALALLASGVAVIQASAHEPGDFAEYFRGVTIGDPFGAAPPPGLYFENVTLFAPNAQGHGQDSAFKINAPAEIPILYWSTGWNFLGASYSMLLSQPYYEVNAWLSSTSGPPFPGATHFPAVHNTFFDPLLMSWNFKNGWFASVGLGFYAPDGSTYNNSPNPDYWTFQPAAAISYLGDGWDLTAHFVYNVNTSSTGHTGSFAGTAVAAFGVGYHSGDQAYVDLTATKKFGKWEIGPVGYLKWQTTADSPGGGVSCATMAAVTAGQLTCGRATDFALGGLVGYDFGPAALKVFVTDSVYTNDDFGGVLIWTKLSFRLWAPEPPASSPLIKKAR